MQAQFIRVTIAGRVPERGEPEPDTDAMVAIADIAMVRQQRSGTGSIIERYSNKDFPVWTTNTPQDIISRIQQADPTAIY
jgi:hypothetical protein